MPADVKAALMTEALVRDHVQHKIVPKAKGAATLYFAWKNVPKRFFLYRLAQMSKRHEVKIHHLRFTFVDPLSIKCVLLGAIELESVIIDDSVKMMAFMREFEMLKDLKDDVLTDLVNNGTLTGNHGTTFLLY